jgi:SAM-dependent methyltransferase
MKMNINQNITLDDFCSMFRCAPEILPKAFLETIDKTLTNYHYAGAEELSAYLLQVLKRIESPGITRSVAENKQAFEKGWTENLEALRSGKKPENALKPAYFRTTPFLRYNRSLIVSENLNIEYDLFILARIAIFTKYLAKYCYITEIGCGSCQNLLLLARLFPTAKLIGLDWTKASTGIANDLSRLLKRDIKGLVFNMLSPEKVPLKKGSAIITIHAMEQLGKNYEALLQFILNAEPGIVVHYEPILEFYDEENLFDYVALLYSRKRNYLTDYFNRLQGLAGEGMIQILDAYRPNLGGVIHEASIIVWKPLGNKSVGEKND